MIEASLLYLDRVSKTFVARGRIWPPARRAEPVRGLREVSFTVNRGEVVALLGPNGAGKTTIINVLCDLVRADGGSLAVAGLPVPRQAREARGQIGLVTSNERSFIWQLTGRQNLDFFGSLQRLPRGTIRERSAELLERFGLAAHADRPFRTYSTGMRKRLALVRALLHDPAVLLMDEATNGLDPATAEQLLHLTRTRVETSGRCVLWATHRVDEVFAVAQRVLVLIDGEIRFNGDVAEFGRLCAADVGWVVEIEPPPAGGEIEVFIHSIGAQAEADGARLCITLPGARTAAELSPVLQGLIERGAAVRRVEPKRLSLNEAFLRLADKGEPARV